MLFLCVKILESHQYVNRHFPFHKCLQFGSTHFVLGIVPRANVFIYLLIYSYIATKKVVERVYFKIPE